MIASEMSEFEDRDVQVVYDLLCGNEHPPNPEEHWEGWIARRIVAALRLPATSVEGWLTEIDAREKAATPGEWTHKSQTNTADARTEDYVEIRGVRMFGRAEDCDFVACARRDIPTLCRYIDRQASELSELQQEALSRVAEAEFKEASARNELVESQRKIRTAREALKVIAFHVPVVTILDGIRVCDVDEVFNLKSIAGKARAALFDTDVPKPESADSVVKEYLTTHHCTICGGLAEWLADEKAWRHAGDPMRDGFLEQSFCHKYGYPIDVQASKPKGETE